MSRVVTFFCGFVLCCGLVVSMGAQNAPDDYTKACIGFQAESLAAQYAKFNGNQASIDAANARRDYWFKQMEKFKPQ